MRTRRYEIGEEQELWQLYRDTTQKINGKDYTKEQCERWAPHEIDLEAWKARLAQKNPFVVEHQGQILGFAELESDGHIDLFYVHHQWQRKGVGRLLARAIEAEALERQLSPLHAAVSITAKAFFLAWGFQIVEEQHNVVCGAIATRYLMRKRLPAG